ncbi:MAG TPA: MotA/TolQ/ExbB proton channel family protein [Myxococcota bacterium]|nr:MotA/TolQ/ExbB proton channel family protein [Myxococcota bacterium]
MAARSGQRAAARPPAEGARTTLASALLGLLAAAPVAGLLLLGIAPGELPAASARGLAGEVDSVGWVFVPQLVLAVGILGLALQQGVRRAAGLPRLAPPGWLSPAVESALLLGLLGTISGMVAGFAGISPAELEPAPLVRGLGAALRSTFVGFAIALVGVWLRDDELSLARLDEARAASFTGEGPSLPPHPPPSGRPGTRS